jgi:hypothetical protein
MCKFCPEHNGATVEAAERHVTITLGHLMYQIITALQGRTDLEQAIGSIPNANPPTEKLIHDKKWCQKIIQDPSPSQSHDAGRIVAQDLDID